MTPVRERRILRKKILVAPVRNKIIIMAPEL
jgi:hypothetical protein